MNARLIWITPDADKHLGYIARVSAPQNQDNPDVSKLLAYCGKHGHWSVFEHASACIEINTTRDIARQILRHRSFAFSEFSTRYQDVTLLGDMVERECRLQDTKNRQNSLECDDLSMLRTWEDRQKSTWQTAKYYYDLALKDGTAKEQARSLLPEGLTPSRLYMTGSLRSWIHYIQVRADEATQKEHRLIACQVRDILLQAAPIAMGAFFDAE